MLCKWPLMPQRLYGEWKHCPWSRRGIFQLLTSGSSCSQGWEHLPTSIGKHRACTCHLQHLQHPVCARPSLCSPKRVLDAVVMDGSSMKNVKVLESSLYLNILSENTPSRGRLGDGRIYSRSEIAISFTSILFRCPWPSS